MDGQTYGHTDTRSYQNGQMDRPSYRDARMNLVILITAINYSFKKNRELETKKSKGAFLSSQRVAPLKKSRVSQLILYILK